MKRILVILLFGVLSSCVSPFEFTIDDSEQSLVVEGRLFEIDSSYVSLKYDFQKQNTANTIIIKDANVMVLENGNREILFSYKEGSKVYTPIDKTFKGIQGNTYQLKVLLSDGNRLESSIDTLLETQQLESVSDDYRTEKKSFDVLGKFPNKNNTDNYYLFNFINYRNANWCASCLREEDIEAFDKNGQLFFNACISAEPLLFVQYWGVGCLNYTTCWDYQQIKGSTIYSDAVLASGSEKVVNLFQVPMSSREMYFLEIHQSGISKKAYEYFNLLNNSKETGTLFDPVPALIVGNIYEEGNPDSFVLGYFLVAGQQFYGYNVDRSKIDLKSLLPLNPDIEVIEYITGDHPNGIGIVASCAITDSRTNIRPKDWVVY